MMTASFNFSKRLCHNKKGAMFLAISKDREAYFKYLCGLLRNWRKELEQGNEPRNFDIGGEC